MLKLSYVILCGVVLRLYDRTCRLQYLGLTWLTGMLSRAAMSSTVSLPSEMMPTPLAMALAVIGWSPVTMMTLMPADLHLPTASGTAARGGSIMDIRPRKQRLSVWKFTSSVSKANPLGYWSSGKNRWQKPAWTRAKEKDRVSLSFFSPDLSCRSDLPPNPRLSQA